MRAKNWAALCGMARFVLVSACLALLPHGAHALAWEAKPALRYNIEDVAVNPAGVDTWTVDVVVSVTNTATGERCDIRFARPFRAHGAGLTPDTGRAAGADLTDSASDAALVSLVSSTALGGGMPFPAHLRSARAMHTRLPGYGEGASCRGGDPDRDN
jgi:hypothetical protein